MSSITLRSFAQMASSSLKSEERGAHHKNYGTAIINISILIIPNNWKAHDNFKQIGAYSSGQSASPCPGECIHQTYPVTHDCNKVKEVIKVHKSCVTGAEDLTHSIPEWIHLQAMCDKIMHHNGKVYKISVCQVPAILVGSQPP